MGGPPDPSIRRTVRDRVSEISAPSITEVGAGLRSYTFGGADVIDGFGEGDACTSGRGQQLIPWPNRIEDGSYEFDGDEHQLPLTEPQRKNAIHGLVRGLRGASERVRENASSWSSPSSHSPAFRSRLDSTPSTGLTPKGSRSESPRPIGDRSGVLTAQAPIHISRSARQRSIRSCFSCPRGPSCTPMSEAFHVRGTRRGDRVRLSAAAGDRRHKLDHALTDFERDGDGLARTRLAAPDGGRALELWMDAAYTHLMLFTGDPLPDVARRSLAVEPMTCAPNAFRSGEGVISLEPSQSVSTAWGISPQGAA